MDPRQRKRITAASRYYLTPKGWGRACSHCGAANSVAFRARDRKRACRECVARLGIRARESRAWRDGGSRAGSAVAVRFVDPASLR